MFSKTCEYAIRACIYIAHNCALGKRSGLKEIASAIDSPEAFTAKILQTLSKAEVIASYKGPHGGFCFESDQLEKTTLEDIVRAIDGDKIFTACVLGLEECSGEAPCPVHREFVEIREYLKKTLHNTRIAALSSSMDEGLFSLK